jgi:hypothetical protein
MAVVEDHDVPQTLATDRTITRPTQAFSALMPSVVRIAATR